MSTASISTIAVLNHIKDHDIQAQLISFDIKSAFDSTLYETSKKIIKHIFPKGNFAEAWTNLTTGGKFRVSVNQCFSDYQSIRKGDPQGGPSAQTKFNIYMHVFISLLQAPCMQNLSLYL